MNRPGNLKLELLFAYIAAAAKVGAWVVISAMAFRQLGAADLGILALARSTVGLLAYAGAGLAPALVHRIARARRPAMREPAFDAPAGSPVLYATPALDTARFPSHRPYSNGLLLAAILATFGLVAANFYAAHFAAWHSIALPRGSYTNLHSLVLMLGLGTLFRLVSDVPAAVVQTSRLLWLDYAVLAAGEIIWVGGVAATPDALDPHRLDAIGVWYAYAGLAVLTLRIMLCGAIQRRVFPDWRMIDPREMLGLLGFGLAVILAQLADFLYAPTDYILINHFLGAASVAAYAPAVQFDSALALVVTVLAGVLLPRTALAHAAGDHGAVRRLYVRGTLASILLLIPIAVALWLAAPLVFRLWLGNDMPETRRILPLVLFHTILGGSSIVGRSVLLGIGRVRAYAVSVLVAGIANVLLSWFFVSRMGLGLAGIVLGTIIVIAGRCAVWMPLYILRTIRQAPAVPLDPGAQLAAQEYAP